jgi:hypothetical protein
MPSYYWSGNDYGSGEELVRRIYRDTRRDKHHPTQYIVNDGTMTVNGEWLRNKSSVIYNSPGSTMYLQSGTTSYRPSSDSSEPYRYYSSRRTYGTSLHHCRGCNWRRELTGGYCRDCIAVKLRPRVVEVVRDDRVLLGSPERRLIEYR